MVMLVTVQKEIDKVVVPLTPTTTTILEKSKKLQQSAHVSTMGMTSIK